MDSVGMRKGREAAPAGSPKRKAGIFARLGKKYGEKIAALGILAATGLGGLSCALDCKPALGPCLAGSARVTFQESGSSILGEMRFGMGVDAKPQVHVTITGLQSVCTFNGEPEYHVFAENDVAWYENYVIDGKAVSFGSWRTTIENRTYLVTLNDVKPRIDNWNGDTVRGSSADVTIEEMCP